MSKYIYKLIGFFLPLLAVFIILDFWVSHRLKKSHGYAGEIEVWEDIYNGRIQNPIAIYGSSRAWVHVDPQIIQDTTGYPAYNFGIDGHNFWLQYFRHKEYLTHNDTPKVIICSVDAFSLQKRSDLFNLEQFLPYMFADLKVYEYTKSYLGFSLADYYVPFVRYLNNNSVLTTEVLLGQIADTPLRTRGFKGNQRVWSTDLKKAKKEMQTYKSVIDSSSLLLFEDFLTECKEADIELILVWTPTYIEGQNFIKNRAEQVAYFKTQAQKYNFPFWDYSTHTLCQDTTYFYNALHLNATGAEIFSKDLASKLKSYFHTRSILLN